MVHRKGTKGVPLAQQPLRPAQALSRKEVAANRVVRYVPASLMIGILDPNGEGLWKRCPDCYKYHTGRRFCSRICGSRYWSKLHAAMTRAKTKGAAVLETIALGLVAERDGWRCHICKKKVEVGDASVDHLVPLSKGGDHSWENVSLAHKRCNSRRGPGRLPAQLRLLS